VGTELFLADRRTDGHDEANSGFSHFSEIFEKETVAAQESKTTTLTVCCSKILTTRNMLNETGSPAMFRIS